MTRRLFRFLLTSGLLLVVGVLVRRSMHLRDEATTVVPSRDAWTPITETLEPEALQPEALQPQALQPGALAVETVVAAPAPEPDLDITPVWLPPVDGACPPGHLIKAKAASGIYHLPGMLNYDRTKPDRCYAEEDAAATDGFTRAKR